MKRKDIDFENILFDRGESEDLLEVPLADRVFTVFYLFVVLIGGVILAQLIRVGVANHAFYAKRALANITDVGVDPAPRGIIYDRFGKPLLRNEPDFSVFLIPKKLSQDISERIRVFSHIADMLHLNEDEILSKVANRDWSLADKLFLKNNLSHDELVSLAGENIPGIEVEPTFKRVGEEPEAFAHVIGYTTLVDTKDIKENPSFISDDTIGRAGLESEYDAVLRGVTGKKEVLKNAKGEIQAETSIDMARPGNNLHTFIDKEFQSFFYKELENTLRGLGRNVGVGMAFDPRNGEVLALLNIPSFDASHLKDFLTEANQPLFNRAISGLYNPGSTIKPLHATAALTENVISPEKQIYSPGYIDVPNPYDPEHPTRFLDWRPQGWVDVHSAIARSSNVYFYEVGGGFEDQLGLGIARLKSWWQKFGLREKTGIDLPEEGIGFLPDPGWKETVLKRHWLLGDTYHVAIGQGDLLITPTELLNYISAIANGGKLYEPRIVNEVVDAKGNVVQKNEPVVLKDFSNEVARALPDVRQGMRDGVMKPYGTSYLLHDLPVPVAAKTGTAQIENNAKVNAFFVGYAPYDNPQIAILILVENAVEGSLNVVPAARDVFQWYYDNRLKK